MVHRFVVGKSYRWVGPQKPSEYSVPKELSEIWERGGTHKCFARFPDGSFGFVGIRTNRFLASECGWGYPEESFELVE